MAVGFVVGPESFQSLGDVGPALDRVARCSHAFEVTKQALGTLCLFAGWFADLADGKEAPSQSRKALAKLGAPCGVILRLHW